MLSTVLVMVDENEKGTDNRCRRAKQGLSCIVEMSPNVGSKPGSLTFTPSRIPAAGCGPGTSMNTGMGWRPTEGGNGSHIA